MRRIDPYFFVRPLEPLFFGEPKPFNAGESHFARSQFPPSPMTFQGMVRSQMLRAVYPPLDLDDWSKEERTKRANLVGTSDRLPEGWQLQGPLPAVVEVEENGEKEVLDLWAPAPRFLYRGHSGRGVARGRLLASSQPAMDDLQAGQGKTTPLFGPSPERQGWTPLKGWVDGETLSNALAGAPDFISDKSEAAIPPFVKDNQRQPGIALDRQSNTTRDGMLYLLEHLRFEPAGGFWGSLSGPLDPCFGPEPLCEGVGGAGRKGRLIAFETPPPLKSCWRDLLDGKHLAGGKGGGRRFWLYLLTPVRLEPKERPEGEGTLLLPGGVRLRREALPPNVFLRCLVALTGPPVTLGGMDTAAGRSRPNHAYIPAGSAWLLETETASNDLCREILQKLNNAHPLGEPEEARFGFGHTLVGIEPEDKESTP